MPLLLYDVVGATSGRDRVPGPPPRRGRAVCALGCARPMRFKASQPTTCKKTYAFCRKLSLLITYYLLHV